MTSSLANCLVEATDFEMRINEPKLSFSDFPKVTEIPSEAIPALLLRIAAMQSELAARLLVGHTNGANDANKHDELLTVKQAAERMNCSPDYLYRHSRQLRFTIRNGRLLRFSANGIDKYIKEKVGK